MFLSLWNKFMIRRNKTLLWAVIGLEKAILNAAAFEPQQGRPNEKPFTVAMGTSPLHFALNGTDAKVSRLPFRLELKQPELLRGLQQIVE